MNEYDFIRSFASAFPKSPLQQNDPFTSDAELIRIGDRLWALTIDEFTPEEDLFTSDDPELLGANLATATLSDLLAVGATPAWFMHAVSLPKAIDPSFVSGLSAGISEVLREAGCALCGGDLGCAETWRYSGFAMGPVEQEPLTRIIPEQPQSLWVTGRLGDANLAALTGSRTPRFELRLPEADSIGRFATACIDTSGGFFDSLWLLHVVNPGLRFELELDLLPIAPGVLTAAQSLGFPPEAALLGGAGEYELLFTLPIDQEAIGIDATRIGTIWPGSDSGVLLRRTGKPDVMMSQPPPCPRDAANVKAHIKEVMQMAERLLGRGAG